MNFSTIEYCKLRKHASSLILNQAGLSESIDSVLGQT